MNRRRVWVIFPRSRRHLIEVNTEGALAGLKVLDVAGTIASGYCGKLFADHGAEVINVEPPDGGFGTRREPPFIPGADAPESSALHAYLSTNKASVALDVDAEPAQLVHLVQGSAVILDKGRYDCAAFTAAAPEVVVSTITWFGRHGPYADFKGNGAVCWSLGGMVRNVGPEQGPPWVPTGCGAEVVGGLAAYIGTMGQVMARAIGNATGPVRVDTSIHEANLCFTEVGGVGGYRSGRRGKRLGVNRFAPTYPLGVYACADGWLGVTALTPRQWEKLLLVARHGSVRGRTLLPDCHRPAVGLRHLGTDHTAADAEPLRRRTGHPGSVVAHPAGTGTDHGGTVFGRPVRPQGRVHGNLLQRGRGSECPRRRFGCSERRPSLAVGWLNSASRMRSSFRESDHC